MATRMHITQPSRLTEFNTRKCYVTLIDFAFLHIRTKYTRSRIN